MLDGSLLRSHQLHCGYARSAGWVRVDTFGDHSDVYAADGLPEVILPRTQSLADYASVTSQLIEIFARAVETDEISLYRVLVTADRDVIRVRAAGDHDGSVTVSEGINLWRAADMLLAAACSLNNHDRFTALVPKKPPIT